MVELKRVREIEGARTELHRRWLERGLRLTGVHESLRGRKPRGRVQPAALYSPFPPATFQHPNQRSDCVARALLKLDSLGFAHPFPSPFPPSSVPSPSPHPTHNRSEMPMTTRKSSKRISRSTNPTADRPLANKRPRLSETQDGDHDAIITTVVEVASDSEFPTPSSNARREQKQNGNLEDALVALTRSLERRDAELDAQHLLNAALRRQLGEKEKEANTYTIIDTGSASASPASFLCRVRSRTTTPCQCPSTSDCYHPNESTPTLSRPPRSRSTKTPS
ncbi:hypothetical protein DFP72DRAFT_849739 [Ephemerocybe angulata]|uniref:Uncharacterized protein n=1 Tax=Ephemerocybe angulata TaxID=980116 RepID=A0A8H6HTN9_9AGAR|nr:hypothetical protein DFP72DRAFT_849739 [Tulosesus angulatus]